MGYNIICAIYYILIFLKKNKLLRSCFLVISSQNSPQTFENLLILMGSICRMAFKICTHREKRGRSAESGKPPPKGGGSASEQPLIHLQKVCVWSR